MCLGPGALRAHHPLTSCTGLRSVDQGHEVRGGISDVRASMPYVVERLDDNVSSASKLVYLGVYVAAPHDQFKQRCPDDSQLDPPTASRIVATARQGFVEGASTGLAIAASVAAVGALLAWRFQPAKARRPSSAEDGDVVSANSGEVQLQPIGWVEPQRDVAVARRREKDRTP